MVGGDQSSVPAERTEPREHAVYSHAGLGSSLRLGVAWLPAQIVVSLAVPVAVRGIDHIAEERTRFVVNTPFG